MDLSEQSQGLAIKINLVENTNLVSVNFFNSDESEPLGDIIIEKDRLRPLIDALRQITNQAFPESESESHRTVFNIVTLEGEIEWD